MIKKKGEKAPPPLSLLETCYQLPLEARTGGILKVGLLTLYQSRGFFITLLKDILDQRDLPPERGGHMGLL